MNWITRERPKIDRIACPWLIQKFIDPDATFYFVPYTEVKLRAKEWDAIPYDIPGVEYTHYKDQCTFDYFIKKHEIDDPAVLTIAKIVRAADTDRHDLASQAAGLWAITAGLSFNIKDDLELLKIGLIIYDALYSWAKHLQNQKHTQNPTERLLIEVYRKFLKHKSSSKKIPRWVRELKEIIQDQIDTDLNLSLQEVSKSLQVHPAYLSREFSKYFNDLTFGEYLRKLRCETALNHLKYDSPDIILMDLEFCCMNGIEGIRRIKARYSHVEILIVTLYDESQLVYDSLCSGASGYILKSSNYMELLSALDQLVAGGAPMSSKIARMVVESFQLNPLSPLSRRETEVLSLLSKGHSYTTIGKRLFISRETVKTHLKNIYQKLHVNTKAAAITLALDERYI